jgi:hypothetical protein
VPNGFSGERFPAFVDGEAVDDNVFGIVDRDSDLVKFEARSRLRRRLGHQGDEGALCNGGGLKGDEIWPIILRHLQIVRDFRLGNQRVIPETHSYYSHC